MNQAWQDRRVLVTGGASFIGSHLVDALVARGARVRVVDNLSSGRLENTKEQIDRGQVEFWSMKLPSKCGAQASRSATGPMLTTLSRALSWQPRE
jgi:nucleoside-diphosphate-sugar epimerase